MDLNSIASASIIMHQADLMQGVGFAMMKKTMANQEQKGEAIQQMMAAAGDPNLGQNIDILA